MSEALKKEFETLEEIGRGRFGVIFRCRLSLSSSSATVDGGEVAGEDDIYACKSIDKRLLSDSTDKECVCNEAKAMAAVAGHPNVLRLHAVFEDDHHLHLVTDLCTSSDLLHRISAAGRVFSEQEAADVALPLMHAISHCHRHGLAHRDIKPDNVLFDSGGRLQLADFGSAAWFAGGRHMSGVVGTPYYVAPEVLLGREYGEKVDVWSSGVVLYVMLAGVPPFYGESPADTFAAVVTGKIRFPARMFRSVSGMAKELLRGMICRDVSRRLSAEQVLQHPWMVSRGRGNILKGEDES